MSNLIDTKYLALNTGLSAMFGYFNPAVGATSGAIFGATTAATRSVGFLAIDTLLDFVYPQSAPLFKKICSAAFAGLVVFDVTKEFARKLTSTVTQHEMKQKDAFGLDFATAITGGGLDLLESVFPTPSTPVSDALNT